MEKNIPAFIIDSSALKDMINGDEKSKSKDLLSKLKQMKDDGKEVKAFTPLSSLLRAIWLSESTATINNLQKILSFLIVIPSFSDFKNEEEVRNEIIKIAEIISKEKK